MSKATCNLCQEEVEFNLPNSLEQINNIASAHIKKCTEVGDKPSIVVNPLAFFEVVEA